MLSVVFDKANGPENDKLPLNDALPETVRPLPTKSDLPVASPPEIRRAPEPIPTVSDVSPMRTAPDAIHREYRFVATWLVDTIGAPAIKRFATLVLVTPVFAAINVGAPITLKQLPVVVPFTDVESSMNTPP